MLGLNPKDSRFLFDIKSRGIKLVTYLFGNRRSGRFGFNPNSVTAYGEGEDKDFQLSIFKQLILAGKALQFVPTFREYGAKITASAFFRKGKIFFRLERTEELYDYLLEKELIA